MDDQDPLKEMMRLVLSFDGDAGKLESGRLEDLYSRPIQRDIFIVRNVRHCCLVSEDRLQS